MSRPKRHYARVDVGFLRHPKIAGLTPAQKLAYLALILHSTEFETDGFVSYSDASRALVSRDSRPLRSLVEASLLEEVDGGYRIPSFTEWQEDRSSREHSRAVSRRTSARHRARKRAAKGDGGDTSRGDTVTRQEERGDSLQSHPPLASEGGDTAAGGSGRQADPPAVVEGGADVSEWVPASEAVERGIVPASLIARGRRS